MLNIFKQRNKPLVGPAGVRVPLDGEKRPDFRKYTDPTGELASQDLARALWYVRHKAQLYRLAILALVSFSLLTWGYSGWQLGNYAIFGITADRQLAASAAHFFDYTPIHARYSPQPLQIVSTQILPGGVGKYDVVSELSNPNARWLARFDYYFVVDGVALPKQTSFLMPGETRPLPYFGLESALSPSLATLVLQNISWRRISNKTVVDTVAWQAERRQFSVSNFAFIRSDAPATTTANAHIIKFILTNGSPYSYAAPLFLAVLYNNGTLVQLWPLPLNHFVALENRAVDLRSFVPGLQADELKVFPVINLYDKTVYAPPPG